MRTSTIVVSKAAPRLLWLTVGVVLLAPGLLVGQSHVGPAQLYPKAITPGEADTVAIDDLTAEWECPNGDKVSCTYSQAHRSVSKKIHDQVYDNYEVPANKRNIKSGEVDHFDPLCNGGSNDIKNLWYQPVKNPWNGKNFGFKEKDSLESWICVEVKAGRLKPKEAFDRLQADWVEFYMEVNPKKVKFRD